MKWVYYKIGNWWIIHFFCSSPIDNLAGDGSSKGFCPNHDTLSLKCFNDGKCAGCITGTITGTADVSNGCTETTKPACEKNTQICEQCKSK